MGRLVAPLDSPELAGFVAALDSVNALADGSEGFVWRLQTEDGDATAIRAFDDHMVLLNMSVWRTVEQLREFVYRTAHAEVMRRRREWFARPVEAFVVLWWVPAQTVPTVHEAIERLTALRRDGPTPFAFTFRTSFAAPDVSAPTSPIVDERWGCPAP